MLNKNYERSGSFKYMDMEIRKYTEKENTNCEYYLNDIDFKNLRKKMGMTQKKFSVFLGISERMVQNIEAKKHIGLNILNRLEKVLGQWKFNHN